MNAPAINLLDFDPSGLAGYFAELGEKPYRAQQVLKWIFHAGVVDFEAMTNLSKPLRARLSQSAAVALPRVVADQISEDGTRKWLMRLSDGNCIETVYIPDGERGTLCVSSQVGCPLDCAFCVTAQQGFNRNLTCAEIIGQVWVANRCLGAARGEGHWPGVNDSRVITNVVLMGMGEPLLNVDNVVRACRLMIDDMGFGLSKRRVTLSTAGIVPGLERLSGEVEVSLAVSLHAVNDELRDQLVPINRKYPIAQLLEACRRFISGDTRRRITWEYIMLEGINDSLDDARALVKLLRGIPSKVNLIPFNPYPGAPFAPSDEAALNAFRDLLIKAGIMAITRKPRGQDIDAACGQLAGQVLNRRRAALRQTGGEVRV
ncbi:MAG: bifunctional tRNA (adenosine(37)-C2)-methyltransferase TrmG/ribosomal RNA large subunit methyltransferase RlmN [Gammaproteobacteria bacterium]